MSFFHTIFDILYNNIIFRGVLAMIRQVLGKPTLPHVIISSISSLYAKNNFYPMHTHLELEFLYVISGELQVTVENVSLSAKAGETLFINSDTAHSTFTLKDETQYALIHFVNPINATTSSEYLHKFLTNLRTPLALFKNGKPETEKIKEYIFEILEIKNNSSLEGVCKARAYTFLITSLLYKNNLLEISEAFLKNKDITKILPVISYIDENSSKNITLDELCGLLNFDKHYFCRIFKKATGSTAINYINFVRICKAADLLKTGMNVSQVAYMVGFSSPAYFNSIFKRYKSCSPLTYKHSISNSTI